MHKKGARAILITGKTDFKTLKEIKNKKEYVTMMKEIIHQEDITMLHRYKLNNRASKFM